MDGIPSLVLMIGGTIGYAITRLTDLKDEILDAESVLDTLIQDLNGTKRQLEVLADVLGRAEYSPERHRDFSEHVRELEVKANKVINMIGCISMKLKQKGFFRRAKSRLTLVNSDLGNIYSHIEKINGSIMAIRQEMLLELAINSRNETRVQHQSLEDGVQKINKSLIGTDAKNIRKIYRQAALAGMFDPLNILAASLSSGSQAENAPEWVENEKYRGSNNDLSQNPKTDYEAYEGDIHRDEIESETRIDIGMGLPEITHLDDFEDAFQDIIERAASKYTAANPLLPPPTIAELP